MLQWCRCHQDFVAACIKEVHDFASDEPGAPEDDCFHMFVFGFGCFVFHDDGIILALSPVYRTFVVRNFWM